jgi:hypothetical protein
MRKSKVSTAQLKEVIATRLGLQNTQRRLSEMGIEGLDIKKLTSKTFLSEFELWDNEKKKSFIFLAGGRSNIARTFFFMHQTGKELGVVTKI